MSLKECSVGAVLCLRHPDRWYGGKGRGEEGFGYQQNRCQVFLGCPVSSFRSAKQLSSSSMITSSQRARVSPTVPELLEILGQKPRL